MVLVQSVPLARLGHGSSDRVILASIDEKKISPCVRRDHDMISPKEYCLLYGESQHILCVSRSVASVSPTIHR